MGGRRALLVIVAAALLGACGHTENRFDKAQYMRCEKWRSLDKKQRSEQVTVLRAMQGPSADLLAAVERECTDGRTLAKAFAEATLSAPATP